MNNFPGILVALAPFVVLGLFLVLAMRKSNQDQQEIMRFGRQSGDTTQQIAATLKENNALLRDITERLERLEARNRS